MRLIDADALIKELDRKHYSMASRKQLYAQPTIDAVPVVYCKDCKHFRQRNKNSANGICLCEERDMNYGAEFYPLVDDYCSYGERKEVQDGTD